MQSVCDRDRSPPPWNVDDVTRTMSKGCVCLWMSKSGVFFQFSGGRMTSRGQCPRGGALVNVFTPPPLREILYPRLYSVPPIQVQTPPPPTWMAGYGPGRVWFIYWGLTPQQQPGSYQGGEMMMKSVFWWRKPEYPEETTDLRQVTNFMLLFQMGPVSCWLVY